MSYTQAYFHIVFRTKSSERTIPEEKERLLYMYIYTFSKNKGCHTYRIGGMAEHIHILLDLPATLALAVYVKQLKESTSKWMRGNPNFPHFNGWAEGYAAFSCGYERIGVITQYIKAQKEHHKKHTFAEEYRLWLEEEGMKIEEKYFLKTNKERLLEQRDNA